MVVLRAFTPVDRFMSTACAECCRVILPLAFQWLTATSFLMTVTWHASTAMIVLYKVWVAELKPYMYICDIIKGFFSGNLIMTLRHVWRGLLFKVFTLWVHLSFIFFCNRRNNLNYDINNTDPGSYGLFHMLGFEELSSEVSDFVLESGSGIFASICSN